MRRRKYKWIYAEWTLYGKFYNEIFDSYEAFYSATFCPDCEIITVKEITA